MDFLPDFDDFEEVVDQEEEEIFDELPEGGNPNVVAAFEYYKDSNFFTVDTQEFDGTEEGLQGLFAKQAEASKNSFLGNVPEFAKPLVELVQLKGQNFTEDELIEALNIIKPQVKDFSNEDVAEAYLRESLAKDDLDQDEIDETIEELKYKDKLAKAAERAQKKDIQLGRTKLEEKVQTVKVQQEQEMRDAQDFVNKFQSTLNELPWSNELKTAIQQEFSTGTFKTKLESVFQSPKDLADLVAFIKHYEPAKGFNLETYQKAAFSPTSKKIANRVKSYWGNNSNAQVYKQTKDNDYELVL